MIWTGKWKNQYGSILDIIKQENGMLEGTFESAVDETTKGEKLPFVGVYKDSLIGITCTGGNHVVTYAGMFCKGKMETVWHVVTAETITADANEVSNKKPQAWWESVKTNADTFERINGDD